ncbi:hypothetical protein R1flu_007217 [Riccia fluitans]|uniref:Uncharacterized protein n=1 Tax=Riccia fluitans TaxID=41844 RepID=A0ABD1YZ05_9MARC
MQVLLNAWTSCSDYFSSDQKVRFWRSLTHHFGPSFDCVVAANSSFVSHVYFANSWRLQLELLFGVVDLKTTRFGESFNSVFQSSYWPWDPKLVSPSPRLKILTGHTEVAL